MIRDDIKAATIAAMKSGDKAGTQTLRMVQSAIKNRDIELRTGAAPADDDALVTEVLQKMIKQRRELVELYRKGNREELAAAEEAEIAVIERFLPAQMSDDEAKAAIAAIIAETGAASMKDMGRVMALVKERLGTQHRAGAGERAGARQRCGIKLPSRLREGSGVGMSKAMPERSCEARRCRPSRSRELRNNATTAERALVAQS